MAADETILPVDAVATAPSRLIGAYYAHLRDLHAERVGVPFELPTPAEAARKTPALNVTQGTAATNEISNVAVRASIVSPLASGSLAATSPLEISAALARALQYSSSYEYFWGHTGAGWVPPFPVANVSPASKPAVAPILPSADSPLV
jgi:hypothetical protein